MKIEKMCNTRKRAKADLVAKTQVLNDSPYQITDSQVSIVLPASIIVTILFKINNSFSKGKRK